MLLSVITIMVDYVWSCI